MVSKKLKLLFTLCMLVSAFSFAQTPTGYMGGGYSTFDSSVVPTKRMGQQNEFWNKSYSFPAKPRNMWEIGVKTGIFTVSGDVPATVLTAPNFGVHVRKAFGYLFSLRMEYINTVGKGMQWKGDENFWKNTAWSNNGVGTNYYSPYRTNAGPIVYTDQTGRAGRPDVVYYNYKTNVQDLSLQGIFTVNNVRFHKQKTGIVIYGGAGVGISAYHTKVNAKNESVAGSNYAALFNGTHATYAQQSGRDLYKQRKAIIKALKAGMDNTYETEAEGHLNFNGNGIRPSLGNSTIKPSGTVIGGVAFKLGKRINLAIEDRWTFIKDDLLDGQRWQEHARGDAVLTRDFDSYNFATIGLNFNLGAKSSQPLYWLNPLDYAYSELTQPTRNNLKAPPCEDADGDGVCDFLDKEPNTPAGCGVDTHGVTRDTDGDGVPDCKDKQLITPTECQPVDADGVGKCPVKCCEGTAKTTECPAMDYPSLTFKSGCALSNDNKSMLSNVASKLKANPSCSVSIVAYTDASKTAQSQGNCRVDAIKKYLSEKEGISADRFSTSVEVGDGTTKNTVDIKSN
jgi:hypothetical protein